MEQKNLTREHQVKVSLSLRIWLIASANLPYANIVYRLNRRTSVQNLNATGSDPF
ncbi:MAG: hypothetical protein RIQ94_1349, partial [Pseudomonadota bacterium]